MKEKQLQVLSTCAAKMTNYKYENQKKQLVNELKFFRNYFNFTQNAEYIFEPGF